MPNPAHKQREIIMSLSITYYAPTDSMGNTSEADAAAFRSWAEQQIKVEYPSCDVTVTDEDSTVQVSVRGAASFEDEELIQEIKDYVHRLWDRCPWDFN